MCPALSFILHHHRRPRRHLIGARNTIRHQLRWVSTSTRLPKRRLVRRLRDRTRPWGMAMTIKSGTLAVESSDFPRLTRATVRTMVPFPNPFQFKLLLLMRIQDITIPRFRRWNSPNSMDLTPVGGVINVNFISRYMSSTRR